MPSTSPKQARLMRAVAHDSKFAQKAGVPQKVGKDFAKADEKDPHAALKKQASDLMDYARGKMNEDMRSRYGKDAAEGSDEEESSESPDEAAAEGDTDDGKDEFTSKLGSKFPKALLAKLAAARMH